MESALNTFVLLFFILLISLAVSAILIVRSTKKKAQLLGIQLLQGGRILLMHVQVHRGLTTAFLSGDKSNTEAIYELRADISKDISRFGQLDLWANNHEDWVGITQHWARLSGKSFQLSTDDNFDQHCRLVHSILALMETIGMKYQLESGTLFSGARTFWLELLRLSELVGQSRALGVRILNLGEVNPFLREHKAQVGDNLLKINELLVQSHCVQKFSGQDKERLEHFLMFAQHHLVDNVGLISASEYFKMATQTIGLIYENFDREMNALYLSVSH